MLQKFWPLMVMLAVGVLTLVLLVRQPGKEDESDAKVGEKIQLSDGLVIEELAIGDGARARTGDTVEMQYTGTLASNGNQFDSSVGKPPLRVTIGAGKVIKGWEMGLPGMKEGGRRKLYIPAALAYGDNSPDPDSIPPGSDLVFEVKLLRKLK